MRVAAVLMALCVALAGCSKDADPEPTPDPDDDPVDPGTPTPPQPPREPITQIRLLTDFTFQECDGVVVGIPVDRGALDARLPESYQSAAFAGVGGTPANEALGLVVVELLQCAVFEAAGSSFPDVWFGRSYATIEPVEGSAADSHAYIFEMIGGEDILALLWPAAGYPLFNGTATMNDISGAGTWQASAGGFVLQSAVEPAGADEGTQSFAWYHEMETGDTLLWTGNSTHPSVQTGPGNLEAPDGSVAATFTPGPGLTPFGFRFEQAQHQDMILVRNLAEPQ